MTTKQTLELKPCPFCGGEPRHFHTRVKSCVDSTILLDYDFVRCLECASETRQFCDNKEGAITAWNTRAPLGVTKEEAVEILHYLHECHDSEYDYKTAWAGLTYYLNTITRLLEAAAQHH